MGDKGIDGGNAVVKVYAPYYHYENLSFGRNPHSWSS